MEFPINKIKGYEGFDGYTIDKNGVVRSYHIRGTNKRYGCERYGSKPTVLKNVMKNNGYMHLGITKNDSSVKYPTIHRLLALAFIPNPNNLEQVNHIDGNKRNNSLDNLEWVSRSDNVKHAFKTGLQCHYKKGIVKPVNQYDKSGVFIKKHESISDAIEYIGLKPSSKSAITRVCQGKQKRCGGYVWKYTQNKTKGSTTSQKTYTVS